MNTATQNIPRAKGLNPIRSIVLINFLLLAALIWPLNSQDEARVLDALRARGIGHLIFGALQFWVVGSTLLATALFVRNLVKREGGNETSIHQSKVLVIDGAFLFAWWIILLICCAYAFMLGMAA